MNDQYHVRPSGVVHEVFEDEVVIVNLDSGDYYSLLGPGVPLWDCLLAGCTVGEIVGVLRSRYEGSSDEIEASVRTLIGELEGEDLIVSGETGEPSSSLPDASSHDGDKPHFIAPSLNRYSDMRDLLLIDPIHEVDESGWPQVKKDPEDPS